MISTRELEAMPDKATLQKLCKSISALDAILSPDWEYRYYSYNRKWSEDEEFFGMRDGSGDEMLVLFREEGCVINGFVSEAESQDKEKLTHRLPEYFEEFIFGEPVNTIGTTFCFWSSGSGSWKTGNLSSTDDLSEDMLYIFDGNPETYLEWADDYYFDGEGDIPLEIVSQVYKGKPLTKEMVLSINEEIEDWEQLEEDLKEIGYPFNFED